MFSEFSLKNRNTIGLIVLSFKHVESHMVYYVLCKEIGV